MKDGRRYAKPYQGRRERERLAWRPFTVETGQGRPKGGVSRVMETRLCVKDFCSNSTRRALASVCAFRNEATV